jgi:hypothetical protein
MTVPLKLKRLYKDLGRNYRAVARDRGVNVFWVIQVLTESGIEPKSIPIRRALFLPDHPRQPRAPKTARQPLPDHLQWWRKLPKDDRETLIKCEYQSSLEHGE